MNDVDDADIKVAEVKCITPKTTKKEDMDILCLRPT